MSLICQPTSEDIKLRIIIVTTSFPEEGAGKRGVGCSLSSERQKLPLPNERTRTSELRSCVKVEVDVQGSRSLVVRTVSADAKQD